MLVFKSELVRQLKKELTIKGLNPDQLTFKFNEDDLEFTQNETAHKVKTSTYKPKITAAPRKTLGRLLSLMEEKNIGVVELSGTLGCSTGKIYNIINKKIKVKKDDLEQMILYCEKNKTQASNKKGLPAGKLAKVREGFLLKKYGESVSSERVDELKQLLSESGISMSQVALLSKTTPSLLHKWFNGQTVPRERTFNRVLEVATNPQRH